MLTPEASTKLFGPQKSAKFLDMLPIPAAIVVLTATGFGFEGINQAFRRAGLGVAAQSSPVIGLLGERIASFFGSDERSIEFDWAFGDAVDCRYFRVKIGRRTVDHVHKRALVTLIDNTSETRTENSLRREMMTDSLTGLPNRAGFTEQLETAIAQRSRAAFAVLSINLDRFSRVNACMGGLSGDELLISVARRMKGALRVGDVIARTGGDEFTILMAVDDGPSDALHVARRIEDSLIAPFRLSDFEIRVSCSIGIALGADQEGDAEELVRHAQFAVKRSKKTGRTEVYQTRAFDLARQEFGIETELRRAIDNGALRLAFQPICDLATGRIVAFEALSRWRTEQGVELSPSDFIPVAEESGLIVPLGRWAMAQAIETVAEWDRRTGGDCGVSVAVNLSAIQLQRDRVATMVGDILESHGVEGRRLTIELTESAIVADPDRTAHTIRALKELGTTLAMDDFGTGYSNLAYLQKLPIDVLKIDRSFVSGMLADRDKVAIVRAILSLAQALGMKTTAEGIETNELAQTLTALGCTYGQGYLYARPLPADQAFRLLSLSKN
ncbi:putative bifunctional diguanylate cyclase/phosphodiesterase [Sphingomonas qomolangmaensis]|uniref:Bifunctional diguanylate cyclase/phosphodiesterase n=1 Tax=Sphingomonas qomolangmaensis TaxID=2918765 RepID=A0ABY5LEK9_9SPHN|nr:bifunctional diguanylate cyclase/phosphodiesterase [Sphingomonas qomolangmaensis]UUL84332.1 bifunctional diguanylate cyclase/phosphodiesterase [Sphingomonas qomolangmaensis]